MPNQQEIVVPEPFEAHANFTHPIDFPHISQAHLAWVDIKEGFSKWPVWLMLAYQDIKLRYRRSVLGPFWITLSMAITVYSMGFLYGHLFHMELELYYPFLVAGMLAWSLISNVIIDLTEGLITADTFLKQIKLPYSLYIHRIIARNMIIFFHNMLVIIPVLILFHKYAHVNFNTLLLIPSLLIIYFNALTFGLILGIIGARYRDVSQIIKSLIQVIFFVTPVMWAPQILSPDHQYLVYFNPFYSFIEVLRAPLLGTVPIAQTMGIVMGISLISLYAAWLIFTRFRARIIYWL